MNQRSYIIDIALVLLLTNPLLAGSGMISVYDQPPSQRASQPPGQAPYQWACRIQVCTRSQCGFGTGSLVATDARESYILTAAHLIDDDDPPQKIIVHFPDGRQNLARVVNRDIREDVMLLGIAAVEIQPVKWSEQAAAGTLTFGGFGQVGKWRTRTAPVDRSVWRKGGQHANAVATQPCREGDSGGPVLNSRGQLVGVLWGGLQGESYIAHGQPIRNALRKVLGRPPAVTLRPVQNSPPNPQWSPSQQPTWGPQQGSLAPINKQPLPAGPPEGARNGLVSQPAAPQAACDCRSLWTTQQDLNRQHLDQFRSIDGRLNQLDQAPPYYANQEINPQQQGQDQPGWMANNATTIGLWAAGLVGLGGIPAIATTWAAKRAFKGIRRRRNDRGQEVRDDHQFQFRAA